MLRFWESPRLRRPLGVFAVTVACLACGQPEGGSAAADAMIIAAPVCTDGETRCVGEVEQICRVGQWGESPTDNCRDGAGGDGGGGNACLVAAANRSYLGCEYWPVDLDNAVEVLGPAPAGGCPDGRGVRLDDVRVCWNGTTTAGECDYDNGCPNGFRCQTVPVCALDAQRSPFAIVVANPQEAPVEVTLANQAGSTHTETVQPGALASLFPQALGFADQSLNYSGQSPNAYRLTSSAPIVAYQFNPLDNVDVFSNDGSLLIPSHAYDTQYLAMSLPTLTRRPDTNDYSSYVTIVGSAPRVTIQVTPSADVRAGDGVQAMRAGETYVFTLEQFDVLNLEAVSDGDMTGTRVVSPDGTTPFGVFVGHEAMVLPVQGERQPCCADHIEEQLFPISTWGANFALARSQPRKQEPDLVRILAHRDGTRVSFDPAPASTNCNLLDAGEACDALIQRDTAVNATEPVLVGHMLMSTDGAAGDPALSFAVPVQQYRDRYAFLVPEQYDAQYVSVVGLQGDSIELDGVDVTDQFRPFSDRFMGARLRVQPGQRQLTCPASCGVVAYGYSQAVSYLFAAGLDLEQITVP